MSSSGYGSQAVSTTNLTSDDSLSIKSISVDETPDLEYKTLLDPKKPEKMDSSLVTETPEEYFDISTDLDDLTGIPPISQENRKKMELKEDRNSNLAGNLNLQNLAGNLNMENLSGNLKMEHLAGNLKMEHLAENLKIEHLAGNLNLDNLHIDLNDPKKNDMETSQGSNSGDDSPLEGNSVVQTKLQPGKVVRRRKLSNNSGRNCQSHRASFPMVRPHLSDKSGQRLDYMRMNYENGDHSSSERIDDDLSDKNDKIDKSGFGSKSDLTRIETVPEWVIVGESVMVRPYSYCGVIAYVGGTEFAGGTWIGVELDAPTGKNDGAVNGQRYFTCRPKCGIFVKVDKLIQDKRGRALRNFTRQEPVSNMRRSVSRGEFGVWLWGYKWGIIL